MKTVRTLLLALALVGAPVMATDYTVDFSRVDDLEIIRPLIQHCRDFDALEMFRSKLEKSTDLNQMRSILSGFGFGLFNGCPDNISGPGIAAVKQHEPSATLDYSVDFTRVKNFETLRPLIEKCRDFGGLEAFRSRLESATNLEDMRKTLTNVGFGSFEDCPEGVSGPGITPSR